MSSSCLVLAFCKFSKRILGRALLTDGFIQYMYYICYPPYETHQIPGYNQPNMYEYSPIDIYITNLNKGIMWKRFTGLQLKFMFQ